jgi:hypothetical protein
MKRYLVNFDEWDVGEWQTMEAESHRDAAIRAAKLYDEQIGDYPILGGIKKTIRVRSAEPDSEAMSFCVTGEAVPTYYILEN